MKDVFKNGVVFCKVQFPALGQQDVKMSAAPNGAGAQQKNPFLKAVFYFCVNHAVVVKLPEHAFCSAKNIGAQ